MSELKLLSDGRSAMSPRLGYLVPEFPGQTHVFFWREIRALRRVGQEVCLLSTRRPSPITCRHDFASAAVAETRYFFPPAVSSLASWAASGCRGLRKALDYLGRLEGSGLRRTLRSYGLLASAVDLVQWARLKRIDHVHSHSCADAAHVLALARCLGGPKYSLTLHGDLEVYGTDHRCKMQQAAFVCAVGSHLREQLVNRAGVCRDRVILTCMGVETSELGTLGENRSYTPATLHLATVGRLHPAKGHAYVLAAVHRGLQAGLDLRYTIAGEGPHRESLLSLIRELGLGARVTLTGTLSEREVFQLLSKADVFVLASTGLGEAWPVSVMEAMGAGLPVIATVIGATPEMITSGRDGFLVPQGDERALLENIMLLANDVEARRRIGDAARRTAHQCFDVAVTAGILRDAVRNAGACQ
jgi:glycosyltransferase involved in cell wall biosynthesis